jgi:hypothetical protein
MHCYSTFYLLILLLILKIMFITIIKGLRLIIFYFYFEKIYPGNVVFKTKILIFLDIITASMYL